MSTSRLHEPGNITSPDSPIFALHSFPPLLTCTRFSFDLCCIAADVSCGNRISTMNCPSRTEEPEGTGYNQNPSALAADLTTRQDLNGMANTRVLRRIATGDVENVVERVPDDEVKKHDTVMMAKRVLTRSGHVEETSSTFTSMNLTEGDGRRGSGGEVEPLPVSKLWFKRLRKVVLTFGKFVGPGFMASVPGSF